MTGGRRPPGPTPPSWLDLLPVITEPGQLQDGKFYVAVTTLTGDTSSITNPIIECVDGRLQLVKLSTADNSVWYYDAESENLRHDGLTSNGMATSLQQFLGSDFSVTVSRPNVNVTIDDVVGKFV